MNMQYLLGLAIALAFGLLFSRGAKLVRLPNVTAYLVAGLLVGPFVLNLLPKEELRSLDGLITVALGFIAFSIGGEFKFSHIKEIGARSITITFFESLTAVVLVDVVLIAFGFDKPLALSLGAIAAATAPAATLLVVRQYKAKGPVTSTLLPVVAMDDAVGLMAFSISISLAQSMVAHQDMNLMVMLGKPLLEIVMSLGLGIALGGVATLALRFFHSRDNFLCICIAAVFAGVSLASMWSLSSLLLCMGIGATVANLHHDSDFLFKHIERWTPPLFMVFFVLSGADLDLSIIPSIGLLGILYLLARSAGKYLGAGVGARVIHAHPNVCKYLGVALLPQAGVAIGMAQLTGTLLPAYSAQIRTVILCATLVYELFGPILTKIALTRACEIPPKQDPEKPVPKVA